VLSLVVSIVFFWLALRWLLPRMTAPIEPPPPQLVVHLHLIVPVKERGAKYFAERAFDGTNTDA
jgi:hypothetical protein